MYFYFKINFLFYFSFFPFIFKILFLFILIIYSQQQQQFQEQNIRSELVEALLTDSLRLRLIQACQNDRVNLQCPKNTYISPHNAFFGRLVPSSELCPFTSNLKIKENFGGKEDTSCDFAETLSRITDLCRAKRKCRLKVEPEVFGEKDPCPNTGKYLQIGYKCTPVSFEDQNFCEGQQTRLGCARGQRLSIYSAHYGRSSNGQQTYCGGKGQQKQEGNVRNNKNVRQLSNDCLLDVLPQIASHCHAQPWCSFQVNDYFLGNPCQQQQNTLKYLSVIFACVDEEVFSEGALSGRLEAMGQLKKELDSFQRQNNNSNNLIPQKSTNPRIERHPLLAEDEEEEDENEDFDHEEEEEDEYGDKKKKKEEGENNLIKLDEVEEKNEEVIQVKEKETIENIKEKTIPIIPEKESSNQEERDIININNNVDWKPAWPLLNDRRHEALLFLLLLLSFFLSILILLCACLMWQCRARAKERRDRRRAEEREAAANLRLCHGFGCGSGGNIEERNLNS
uniref:SUEL-type lectin domain-containing protein n=1 Tax=Meloidogyne enterolobii TaxID=390850 RepID=A0A6V7TNP4_MELEN|nr:unnamed protein product [Meloidogyne enterolobii]